MKYAKQTKEYNCGPTACSYYLERFHSIHCDIEELEHIGKCTDEEGTSHAGMFNILFQKGLKPFSVHVGSIKELTPSMIPCIVNYQYDGDGHYGVLIGFEYNQFLIWNPATGKVDREIKRSFSQRWYSKRYGKRWLIR